MKILNNLNLNLNELQNVRGQGLASDPASPVARQFWFNTTSNVFKFFDGTNTYTFETAEAVLEKLSVSGLLKGDGVGGVSAAVAGTDYGYPTLTGSTAPTTATEGAVGQHYLNTTSGVEYVCKAVTTSGDPEVTTYTWVPVTTDISGKQDKITASGILKGDGDGGVTAATADTDYQSVITVTANKALVSDANGKVAASTVTDTELGYLSGATGNIQDQLDSIPKYNFVTGVSATVADAATQSDIDTAAIAAITAAHATASKYDACDVRITFTPSDKVKDATYWYNGTTWVFLHYTNTGIQLASGTTAGLIQEADSNSDLTLAGGVATVNVATALRTARTFSIEGDYGESSTDGITMDSTPATFDGTGNVTLKITGIKPEMLSAAVPVSKGGTGKTSITEDALLIGNSTGGFDEIGLTDTISQANDDLIPTAGAVRAAIGGGNVAHKYTETNAALTPSNGVCSWVVTHNLNSRAVSVDIAEAASPYEKVLADIEFTSVDTVTIKIVSSSNIAAGTYQVSVIG